jgi:hypothetical protein
MTASEERSYSMRRENRKPTRREWSAITSRRPVVRRIPKPESEEERLDRIAAGQLDAHLEDEDTLLRWDIERGA